MIRSLRGACMLPTVLVEDKMFLRRVTIYSIMAIYGSDQSL